MSAAEPAAAMVEPEVIRSRAAEIRERLRAAGATWCVVLPVGPADRLDVIAAATPR